MQRRMIFHAPFPLDENATSASGIRPIQMLAAFEELGYEVWLVTGYSRERRRQIARVRSALRARTKFDFCYSESSTMPMTMTDPHHLPLHPLLDHGLFRHLRRHGVRVGHYLRDIHWVSPNYRTAVRFPKRQAALLAYRFDQAMFQQCLDVLYLPSRRMADLLSLPPGLVRELPPATQPMSASALPNLPPLRLFYVGGMGAHYQLHQLFAGVTLAAERGCGVELTVCTIPEQWQAERAGYERYLSDAIHVVHGRGAMVTELLEDSHVGTFFVAPDDYLAFAVPVKTYEYIGAHRPIIASEGTLAGEWVEAQGVGWSIPYSATALADLLERLVADGELIAAKAAHTGELAREHTWVARARQVAADLSPR
ncbi:glycosyl transferase family 1 [Tessaracoccus sp. MC1679]|uniref:glycosyl transferase family 1 n=1 Tax=Tessaracoccus sp. MC1679 TaxID=2760313 RepID=UPI0016014301|nr:glycosyl transferase family 1 [Tessaracoccus sp. MC1679]MBB1514786.1 glycosyl transferase family 1 [Tessaracoccus sp. MC1679]